MSNHIYPYLHEKGYRRISRQSAILLICLAKLDMHMVMTRSDGMDLYRFETLCRYETQFPLLWIVFGLGPFC